MPAVEIPQHQAVRVPLKKRNILALFVKEPAGKIIVRLFLPGFEVVPSNLPFCPALRARPVRSYRHRPFPNWCRFPAGGAAPDNLFFPPEWRDKKIVANDISHSPLFQALRDGRHLLHLIFDVFLPLIFPNLPFFCPDIPDMSLHQIMPPHISPHLLAGKSLDDGKIFRYDLLFSGVAEHLYQVEALPSPLVPAVLRSSAYRRFLRDVVPIGLFCKRDPDLRHLAGDIDQERFLSPK